MAYLNKNRENAYYDIKKTLFPDILEKTPLKFAINKRNLYMIEKSQYMICCIDNTYSNAYTFVKAAMRKKLSIINIGKYNLKQHDIC